MRALLRLRMREQKTVLLAYALGLAVFSGIMAWSYEAFSEDTGFLTQMFVQFEDLMQAFVGVGFSLEDLTATYLAMTWRHPLILFLLIAFGVERSSGLARELQTGTGDLLFTLPYPRYSIIFSDFLATTRGLLIINLLLVIGVYLFSLLFGVEDIPALTGFFWVFLLSFFLHLMFSALALLVATLSRTGGQALGWTVGIISILYVGDFLASMQPQLEFIQPFTIFYHYQVSEALAGTLPLWESALFLGLTLILLGGSYFFIQRRDL